MEIAVLGSGMVERTMAMDLATQRFDVASQTSSMSRTTGYTCTAMVNALAREFLMRQVFFCLSWLAIKKNLSTTFLII